MTTMIHSRPWQQKEHESAPWPRFVARPFSPGCAVRWCPLRWRWQQREHRRQGLAEHQPRERSATARPTPRLRSRGPTAFSCSSITVTGAANFEPVGVREFARQCLRNNRIVRLAQDGGALHADTGSTVTIRDDASLAGNTANWEVREAPGPPVPERVRAHACAEHLA